MVAMFYVPRNIGVMSSSQLTKSYFSEGWPNHQPDSFRCEMSRLCMWNWWKRNGLASKVQGSQHTAGWIGLPCFWVAKAHNSLWSGNCWNTPFWSLLLIQSPLLQVKSSIDDGSIDVESKNGCFGWSKKRLTNWMGLSQHQKRQHFSSQTVWSSAKLQILVQDFTKAM